MSAVRAVNAWYLRLGPDAVPGRWRVRCYLGDQFPDGQTVSDRAVVGELAGTPVLWETSSDEDGWLHIELSAAAVPSAPPLWFVALPGRPKPGEPPTHALVAYDTAHLPPGTVIDGPEFFMMPVRSEEQVAAVQWDPSSGIVRQVFVRPDRRRQDVGTKLVYAASALHQAHGWPGVLRSDGRRTEMGQAFTAGLRHPGRVAAWTEKSPPMDPQPGPAD